MDFSRASHFPSHLFYADDILIFCKASLRNARKIKEILDFYGGLSSQICNSQKSHMFFSKGVSPAMQRGIVSELGFGVGSLPVNYLGVPLFADFAFEVLRTRYLDNFSHAKWALASSLFWTSIRDLFPDVVVDMLLIPIGDEKDAHYWKPSATGKVTSALAYAEVCRASQLWRRNPALTGWSALAIELSSVGLVSSNVWIQLCRACQFWQLECC
ncbi:uncharacterized protein LOC130994305 [Salvia miltiorrhiza]|uniref:uncharacterized protein LOC130994305 n=1 Tax=Salvia miltiorrhiza TaxID=226208 RepID=UPI0025AD5A98|nr:uncharacterized protein LOC130994305 [Salvia miltiorrhiza]